MKTDRWLLLGIIALLLALSTALVLPYAQFVLAAIVIAFVLRPLQRRLSPRIGDTPAAISLVVVSVVAIVVPFFVIAGMIAGDAVRFVRGLQDRELRYAAVEDPIADRTGIELDLEDAVHSSLDNANESLFGGAMSAFELATHLIIGIGLLLFLLFFFVRDGDRFVAWIRGVSPMPARVTDELIDRLRSITSAVLAGHLLVAIFQGLVAGIGLFAVGIPNTAFWTFVMILLALIPIIGTFVVWAPASVYLISVGNTFAGGALFIYGLLVVGISDEYLRPIVVDRYAELSPSLIIVGVIGGLSVFGFMGLFIGPIVIGALKGTIEVYNEHYGHPRSS